MVPMCQGPGVCFVSVEFTVSVFIALTLCATVAYCNENLAPNSFRPMFMLLLRSKCHSVRLATLADFALRFFHPACAAARHCSDVRTFAAPTPRLPNALKYFRTPGVTVTFSTGICLTIRNRCDTCQDKMKILVLITLFLLSLVIDRLAATPDGLAIDSTGRFGVYHHNH